MHCGPSGPYPPITGPSVVKGKRRVHCVLVGSGGVSGILKEFPTEYTISVSSLSGPDTSNRTAGDSVITLDKTSETRRDLHHRPVLNTTLLTFV